jgi:hypothetical protein
MDEETKGVREMQTYSSTLDACRSTLRHRLEWLLSVPEETATFSVSSEISRAARALAIIDGSAQ